MSDYTEPTRAYVNSLLLKDRQKLGQFMTPNWVGRLMAEQFTPPRVADEREQKIRVLDPAVGTGELIRAFKETHGVEGYEFHGWDVDDGMLKTAKINHPDLIVHHRSIYDPIYGTGYENFFDYIIGNPPYFELKKNNPELVATTYKLKNIQGRLNIYALFFEYGLQLLKNKGELVYLVPPSMNNGAYFVDLRELLLNTSVVNNIMILPENNHFQEALTSVQIVHLTKQEGNSVRNRVLSQPYTVDFNTLTEGSNLPTIFTTQKNKIVNYWAEAENIHQLGFTVFTGKTVWNKHKTGFVKENTPNSAPLIYSKDITGGNLIQFNRSLDEKRWLPDNLPSVLSGNKILVNRIVGSLTNPKIKSALITSGKYPKYFGENHVNIIEPTPGVVQKITLEELHQKLVTQNFSEYLQSLTGNTQLSAKELGFLLPIKM